MYNQQHTVKSAEQVAFENAYWNTMTEKAAAMEQEATEVLFNNAFENQIQKLAALDPSFAEAIHEAEVKQAFNQQFEATCAQYGVSLQQ